MAINYANLEAIKYPPELLPDAAYFSPAAGADAEVLNLTRLPANMLVRIKDIGAQRGEAGTLAELRLKADSETFNVPTAAIPNLTEPTQFDLLASKSARILLHAIDDLTGDNYKVWYGLWAWKATIAEKLVLGIPLNAEERAINDELGIYKTVERGTLPAKQERINLYEHYPIYRETRAVRQTVTTDGLALDTIRPIRPREQFVVLEKISCEVAPDVVGNTRITLWRDDDGSAASPFISLDTWVTALSFDIPMWIPALRELNLRVETDDERTDYRIRWTYSVMRLTNILRMRWGLLAKEDNPDLWKRVVGGIV